VKGKPVYYAAFRDPATNKIGAYITTQQTNESAAHRWCLNKLEKAKLPELSTIMFNDWAKPFYGEGCPHVSRLSLEGKHFADKTLADNHRTIETYILKDAIASALLVDIHRAEVLAFRDRLIASAGRTRTAQKTLGILRVILREALFREIISADPTAGVGKITYEAKVRSAVGAADVRKLLASENWEDKLFHRATIIAAMTGLRAGEVRALQWGDLDMTAGMILVRRALSGDASEPDLPKWGKLRSCPYPAALQAILEPLRKDAGEWVLLRCGGPIGYGKWAASVRAAAKKAKLSGVTLHVLRHSLNTSLRGGGSNDELLRGAFGWSGPEVQEGYTHRAGYDYSELSKSIDELFTEEKHGK